jgi:hypothetical protein
MEVELTPSSGTFVSIPGLDGFPFPDVVRNKVELFMLDQTGAQQVTTAGSYGTIALSGAWDGSDATLAALKAKADALTAETLNFKAKAIKPGSSPVVYSTQPFTAEVSKFTITVAANDAQKWSGELTVKSVGTFVAA